MRIVALSLLVLWTLTLAGCQSKAAKVKQLQDQYNAEYPAYAKDCLDPETAGSSDLLTGKKLTQEEIAALEAKKKEREARCKPQADRLARTAVKQHEANGDEGMKQMKKLTLTVLAVGFAALQPFANAQFGSGIVFDPTQAGHAVTQIENEQRSIANEVRQIEQGQQIFTNTVKIATTALQAYNVAKQQYELTHQMILAPRMLYARFLSPTSDLLLLQQISNTYGNSMGWLNSANTGKGAASAYQQVSVPNTNNMIPGYGTASMAGQLQIAAQGATVDISDSVMTNNLQSLGTIRANQTARQTDIANLEAATQTQDPSQQTIMAELQRINQALLLQLRTLQDANQINSNLALQQIIAQKQQQDAMKSTFRDSSGYESYYNANITTTSSGSANLLTQAY
jgi:hypothetical protein